MWRLTRGLLQAIKVNLLVRRYVVNIPNIKMFFHEMFIRCVANFNRSRSVLNLSLKKITGHERVGRATLRIP